MTTPDGGVQLVVPCFNEVKRFDHDAFASALQAMPWLHLCFVDDGSTDATLAALERVKSAWPTRVRIVSLLRNLGKAEAVRQGMLASVDEHPLCGFWDADLAAPLSELPAMRAVLVESARFEWVWGIRLQTLGRNITRRPLRHYLGRLFATVASLALRVPSYDTQCGAKLFRVSPLLRAVIAQPFCSRWVFDVELLSRADSLLRADGAPGVAQVVLELPLTTWEHRAGSKVRPGDFLRAVIDLVRIRRQQTSWDPAEPFGSRPSRLARHGR